jgi:glycine oxidase
VPDVVVIGGGLIGMGVARRCAQLGLRVMVTDPSPGGGASRVAAGMLAPVAELHYGETALLHLNLESNSMFPDFVAELEEVTGLPTGFHRSGTLLVGFDNDDMAVLADLHDFQSSLGLAVDRLDSRATRRLEPLLAPTVRGGILVQGDNQADPRRLHTALLTAAEAAGVEIRREPVAALLSRSTAGGAESCADSGRATGVRLASGERIPAETVVLAAGCWSASLDDLPEAALPPVRPVKGQLLRLRPHTPTAGHGTAPGFLRHTVGAVVKGSAIYIVSRPDGEVVVGATTEELGFDTGVTAGAVYELLRDARALVPTITELALTEPAAGLRPGSPDNAPLLGESALPGLVVATGHYRNGVLLTPITAATIAELIATGRTPDSIKPFSPRRFMHTAATGAHPPIAAQRRSLA